MNAEQKENTIAGLLQRILGEISSLTKAYGRILDSEYPARYWNEKDVFEAFNGSALTDDPVYDDRKELAIYLRGVWDGEYRAVQNIIGNLERYSDMDVTDEVLDEYQRRIEGFWRDIVGKDLTMILDTLDVESTDDAIVKIKELQSRST